MAVGSSLTDQIGLKRETTWNTYVAPDHFLLPVEMPDFEPAEEFQETLPFGQVVMREEDVRVREFGGAGTTVVDARTAGIGILLEALFGPATTSGSGPYTHVFTPVANPGVSYTVQQGRTQVDGTVQAFNFLGCVCTSLELNITMDQNPRLTATWDVGSHEVTTALATASYPSGATAFSYLDGAITKDGASACFRSLRVKAARAMNTNRQCIGGTKRQQITNGEIVVDGDAEVEFESMTDYNKFRAGTVAALTAALTYGASSLTVAIPVLQYRSNAFGGTIGDVNTQRLNFKALKGASNPLTTWTFVTTDAAP